MNDIYDESGTVVATHPVQAAQHDVNANNAPELTQAEMRLEREVDNHNIRACYEVATRSLCPETWDKFCDALNELCERRGMDNSFMGVNAKPRTWELR